ncbi:methyltransferase domain-containing protein [Streptomyces sp. NPDC048361]|uniref:class I SAM-dependent methyltransferase n=1 Tax=Streptomyces sp. NPDC048361 TaxID=3154720 RepID=UPI00342C80D2
MYATARPDYPARAVEAFAADVGVTSGRRILELGAGTGKFTRQIVARGASVTVVEPVESMIERLRADTPDHRSGTWRQTFDDRPGWSVGVIARVLVCWRRPAAKPSA